MTPLYVIERFDEVSGEFRATGNVSYDPQGLELTLAKLNRNAPGVTRRIQPYAPREGVIKRPPRAV